MLELCKERGLLIGKGGLSGNTLRIKPPMCLTRDDADFLVDCLDEVLTLICMPKACERSELAASRMLAAARSCSTSPARQLAWYSFQVIGGWPVSTSLHRDAALDRADQAAHVAADAGVLLDREQVDHVAAGPGQDVVAAGADHAGRASRASPGSRPCGTLSQRIDWWQPSSQAM